MNGYTFSDGDLEIRPQDHADAEAHLRGEDDQQRIWLWNDEAREDAALATPVDRLATTRTWITANRAAFDAGGPKFCFSVTVAGTLVGYIDANTVLDDDPGVANIAYVVYPAFRRKGYATRAVALILEFLAAHTTIETARLVIDEGNVPSFGVAAASGFLPAAPSNGTALPGRRFLRAVR